MPRRHFFLGGLLAAFILAACHEPTGTASVPFDGQLDRPLALARGRPTGVGVSRGGQVVAALSDTTFVARFAVTADTIISISTTWAHDRFGSSTRRSSPCPPATA